MKDWLTAIASLAALGGYIWWQYGTNVPQIVGAVSILALGLAAWGGFWFIRNQFPS